MQCGCVLRTGSMAEQQLISTAHKQQQQQLGADDGREKSATEDTTLSPLTVEFQKGDPSTTSAPTDAERAQQVRFTLMLLGSSTLAAIALNLESIYVGHIEGDADNGTAQMVQNRWFSTVDIRHLTNCKSPWTGQPEQVIQNR